MNSAVIWKLKGTKTQRKLLPLCQHVEQQYMEYGNFEYALTTSKSESRRL